VLQAIGYKIRRFSSRWEPVDPKKETIMQILVEAANHIAQEIERTRQHLLNLKQALECLKPLTTRDVAMATTNEG
jgi:hypothetical protein